MLIEETNVNDMVLGSQLDSCPTCYGVGFLRHDVEMGHPDFGKLQHCQQCRHDDQTVLPRLWEVSNLDPKLANPPSLENFDPYCDATATMLKATRNFVKRRREWLILHGKGTGRIGDRGTGCWGAGKSHLAEAAARALLSRQIEALFITAPSLVKYCGAVRRAENDMTDYEERILWISRLEVLIIDEFNKESASDATERILLQILDARYHDAIYGHSGATMIVSNDQPDAWHNPAISSRAMDTRFVQITATDLDYRRVKR